MAQQQASFGSVLAVLLIGGSIVWYMNSQYSAPKTAGGAAQSEAVAPASVLSHQLIERAHGASSIIGVVKNTSATKIAHVFVTFNLYDHSGALVGNTIASVDNLEPAADWKFDAPITVSSARTYKLQELKTF